MKDWIAYGVIGAAMYYGFRVASANKVGTKAIVRVVNPRIAKTDSNGLNIRFDILVDNPTNSSVRLTKPVITLTSQGKYLVSSVPENKFYRISPLSQSSLDFAEITIPWIVLSRYLADIISRIPILIQSYQNTGRLSFEAIAIPLEYKYSTYINELFIESPLIKIV